MRMGEILVSRRLITTGELREALVAQRRVGGRLGAVMVEMGLVTEYQLSAALGHQLDLPVLGANAVEGIDETIIKLLRPGFAAEHRCIPIREEADHLVLGFSEPPTKERRRTLENAIGKPIAPVILTDVALSFALTRYYGVTSSGRSLPRALQGLRWVGDIAAQLFSLHHPAEVLEALPELLRRPIGAQSFTVVWGSPDFAEQLGDPLSPELANQARDIARDIGDRVLRGKDMVWLPIHHDEQLRALIIARGFRNHPGDIELLSTFARQASHAYASAHNIEAKMQEARVIGDLSRYVPERVANTLRAQRGTGPLYGRKERVTVLFADVRNFSTLSETMDPDLTVMMLNTLFIELVFAIEECGGSVDKFLGDGVMAFWPGSNAPQAVRAAAKMQGAMKRVNRKLGRTQIFVDLKIGVGLATGVAIVGNVGTPKQLQYTVIGDVVNLAARLCGLAAPDEILFDEATYDLLDPGTATDSLGPRRVKGRSSPVSVLRLISECGDRELSRSSNASEPIAG